MSCKTMGTIKTLQDSEIKFFHYFSLNLLYSVLTLAVHILNLLYSFFFHLSFSTGKEVATSLIVGSKDQKTLRWESFPWENFQGKAAAWPT